MAVDVEWIHGQITQVLQDDEEKSRALDRSQVESAGIARILCVELKSNYACPVPQRTRALRLNKKKKTMIVTAGASRASINFCTAPDPVVGAFTLPTPLAGFKGPTSKGREKGGKGRRGKDGK